MILLIELKAFKNYTFEYRVHTMGNMSFGHGIFLLLFVQKLQSGVHDEHMTIALSFLKLSRRTSTASLNFP